MSAFLALWNGIADAALQAEYEAWHSFEHVPERVGLPGFVQARRWRSLERPAGAPLYFTWYELDSLAALNHARYHDVFAQPTPWTARMRVQLTEFLRLPCELRGAHGVSSAARLVTLQLRARDDAAGQALDGLLRAAVGRGNAVAAHWGVLRETEAIPIANRPGDAPVPGRDLLVLLQGVDVDALRRLAAMLADALTASAPPVRPPQAFELLTEVRRDALTGPLDARQPPRMDFFKSFSAGDK